LQDPFVVKQDTGRLGLDQKNLSSIQTTNMEGYGIRLCKTRHIKALVYVGEKKIVSVKPATILHTSYGMREPRTPKGITPPL